MIALDTNVLVRYLVQDDEEQAAIASELIEQQCRVDSPGYLSVVVLCELVWVLRGAYRYEKQLVVSVLEQLLVTAEFEVEHEEVVRSAVTEFKVGKADFSDYVIMCISREAGCKQMFSFDQKLAKHSWVTQL